MEAHFKFCLIGLLVSFPFLPTPFGGSAVPRGAGWVWVSCRAPKYRGHLKPAYRRVLLKPMQAEFCREPSLHLGLGRPERAQRSLEAARIRVANSPSFQHRPWQSVFYRVGVIATRDGLEPWSVEPRWLAQYFDDVGYMYFVFSSSIKSWLCLSIDLCL